MTKQQYKQLNEVRAQVRALRVALRPLARQWRELDRRAGKLEYGDEEYFDTVRDMDKLEKLFDLVGRIGAGVLPSPVGPTGNPFE